MQCGFRDAVCFLLVCSSLAVAASSSAQRPVTFKNQSPRRADVHWDNGMWGNLIGTVEPQSTISINSFDGHNFWFTAHGVGTVLTHAPTDADEKEPARVTVVPGQAEYALLPSVAVQSGSCVDRYAACTQQASEEMCNDNPGWMIVNCPASCKEHIQTQGLDACALQSPATRCTHEVMGSLARASLGPRELDARFEFILRNFKEFSPRVLSGPANHSSLSAQCAAQERCQPADGPWILSLDNFVREDEIEALLHEATELGFERSTEQGAVTETGEQEKTLSQARTSHNTWCTGECEAHPLVARVHRRIAALTQTPTANAESLQVLSYSPGQYYRAHQDESGRDHGLAGPRIMTLFMYLSPVEQGGHTHFPRLGVSVRPKRGSAILWANMRDADVNQADSRTLHEAKPVIKGQKLAANAWIHNDDYKLPNKWGCTGSFS